MNDILVVKLLASDDVATIYADMEVLRESDGFKLEWPNSLPALLGRVTTENYVLLESLLNYALSQLLKKDGFVVDSLLWATTIRSIVVAGFKIFPSSNRYQPWLNQMKQMVEFMPIISGAEELKPHAPGTFALIATFSMLQYLSRFSTLCHTQTMPDDPTMTLESDLVRIVCEMNSDIALFPIAYISSHVIGIFQLPRNKPRTLKELFEVFRSSDLSSNRNFSRYQIRL